MVSHGDDARPEPKKQRSDVPATAEQRSFAGQVATHTRWSRQDPHAHAEMMRAALMDKLRAQVLEHDSSVVEPELTRRAESLRRAHMARISLLAAQARARKAAAGE